MDKKRVGFHKKILFFICVMMTIIQMIVTTIGYTFACGIITDEVNAKITAQMKVYSNEFDRWINSKEDGLTSAGRSVADFNLGKEEATKILNARKSADSSIMENYIAYPNNNVIFASGIDIPEGLIATEREWYKNAVAANGKMICTDPYIDANTGDLVVTVAKAIEANGSLYCVSAADVTIDELVSKCNEISIYENAYPFLISTNLDFIVHENEEFLPSIVDGQAVFTSVEDVPQYAGQDIQPDTIIQTKDYNDKKVVICTSPLSNGWMLGYSVDYRE